MKNWQHFAQHLAKQTALLVREQVYDGIRSFFKKQDFHEIDTPMLVRSPGTEPYLDLFSTQLDLQTKNGVRNEKLYLLTSPELSLKKVVAAGLPKVFQLTKSFRNNEGLSPYHNPEFSILEWYRARADYVAIMDDCEQLIRELVQKIQGSDKRLHYQKRVFDLTPPWPRLSVAQAFQQYAGLSPDVFLDEEKLRTAAAKKGYRHTRKAGWEELFNQIFLNEIESRLVEFNQPVFIQDYPLELAALAAKKPSDPRFAERFELYLGGIELANAFSELVDPVENKARAQADLQQRQQMGKEVYPLDEDFIHAMEFGLPPTGGIALGVDRLVMLLADVASIQETMFFPIEDLID